MASEKFLKLLDEVRETHIRKSKDYGQDADPMANLNAAKAFGVEPWVATMIRANDKMVRIQSFLQKGVLANESVEDAMLDLGVYALLALVQYRDKILSAACRQMYPTQPTRITFTTT